MVSLPMTTCNRRVYRGMTLVFLRREIEIAKTSNENDLSYVESVILGNLQFIKKILKDRYRGQRC